MPPAIDSQSLDGLKFSSLLGLNQDVLLQILFYCGIHGVLCMSQTCRQLYSLAFDKHVWLALIRSHKILDFTCNPSLQAQSTNELIDLVQRAIRGPESWCPSHPSDSGPVIYHQRTVHLVEDSPKISRNVEPKLLPGGRYILFKNHHTVECWDVIEDKKVWTYFSQYENSDVQCFAVDVVEDDIAAMILIGEQMQVSDLDSDRLTRKNAFKILRLNLRTGVWWTVFDVDTPYLSMFSKPTICGELSAIRICNQIILANWKTQSCVLLDMPSDPYIPAPALYDISLIPNHVILAFDTHRAPKNQMRTICLDIWTVNSFDKHWCPTNSVGNLHAIQRAETPSSASDVVEIPFSVCRDVSLSVRKHPFHDDIYKVWLLATPPLRFFAIPSPSQIYQYSLVTRPSRPTALHLHASFSVDGKILKSAKITYSGHLERHRLVAGSNGFVAMCRQLASIETNAGVDVDYPIGRSHIYLSAYSGALFYFTRDTLVVNFCK